MFKKLCIITTLITCGLLGSAINAFSADAVTPDIVAVDMTKVYQGYNLAQATEKQIHKIEEDAQVELTKMVDEINKIGHEYNDIREKLIDEDAPIKADEDKLKKQLEEKGKLIKEKEEAVAKRRQELVTDYQAKRQKLADARSEEVKAVVTKIAKEMKVKHVLNSASNLAVLYTKEGYDITQKVIDALNAAHPINDKKVTQPVADKKPAQPVADKKK